jgi:hypothetical protein
MRLSSKRVFLLWNRSRVLIPVFKSAIRMIITARHVKATGRFYTKRSVERVTGMVALLPYICGQAKEDLRSNSFVGPAILKTVFSLDRAYCTQGSLTFCHSPFKEHVFSLEFQP